MEFVATFGSGQSNAGHYILIEATTMKGARDWMFENYGAKWCNIYTYADWEKWLKTAETMGIPTEKMLMKVTVGIA